MKNKQKIFDTNLDGIIEEIQANIMKNNSKVIKINNNYYGVDCIFEDNDIDIIFLAKIKQDENSKIYVDINNEFTLKEIFYEIGVFEEYGLMQSEYEAIKEMYQKSIGFIRDKIREEYDRFENMCVDSFEYDELSTEQLISIVIGDTNIEDFIDITEMVEFESPFDEGKDFAKRIMDLKREFNKFENNYMEYVSGRELGGE